MSTKPKMTPWFEPDVLPTRKGVYQTNDWAGGLEMKNQGYQHWNGKFWGLFDLEPALAKVKANCVSSYQRNYWRGLASKP